MGAEKFDRSYRASKILGPSAFFRHQRPGGVRPGFFWVGDRAREHFCPHVFDLCGSRRLGPQGSGQKISMAMRHSRRGLFDRAGAQDRGPSAEARGLFCRGDHSGKGRHPYFFGATPVADILSFRPYDRSFCGGYGPLPLLWTKVLVSLYSGGAGGA